MAPKRKPVQERFDAKWEVADEPEDFPGNGPCHRWTGYIDKQNHYPRFKALGTAWAHRVAWILVNGPIPEGKRIDHRCMRKWCVNVAHLRVTTQKENCEHLKKRFGRNPIQSKHRGVRWEDRSQRWVATVRHNGKLHYAGSSRDEDEAGEMARLLRNRLFTHNDLDR